MICLSVIVLFFFLLLFLVFFVPSFRRPFGKTCFVVFCFRQNITKRKKRAKRGGRLGMSVRTGFAPWTTTTAIDESLFI